jgi:predicted small secreted protein
MNDIKRKLALAALLGLSVASLSACNTVEGAGKDVQKAGEVIEDTAEDAKN